jgi:galactose-1-phosphate uridylyltransferase
MMGASNPHPHRQIWANARLPNEPAKEQLAQEEYRSARDSCLLCDYLVLERELAQRIVCENDYFSSLVPFWQCGLSKFSCLHGTIELASMSSFSGRTLRPADPTPLEG